MTINEPIVLTTEEKYEILNLWNAEYPQTLFHNTFAEFEKYLSELKNQKHFLVTENNKIKAWAFQFFRDNENWFAIIVNNDSQKNGIGTTLVEKLKSNNDNLCGWVIDKNDCIKMNGKSYKSPLNFYLKNDFQILSNVRLETEKLSAVKIEWKKIE